MFRLLLICLAALVIVAVIGYAVAEATGANWLGWTVFTVLFVCVGCLIALLETITSPPFPTTR